MPTERELKHRKRKLQQRIAAALSKLKGRRAVLRRPCTGCVEVVPLAERRKLRSALFAVHNVNTMTCVNDRCVNVDHMERTNYPAWLVDMTAALERWESKLEQINLKLTGTVQRSAPVAPAPLAPPRLFDRSAALPPKDALVYFVQDSGTGEIKIGFTRDLNGRMFLLQQGNPRELLLLAWKPGSKADERHLHIKFAAHRVRGEWFAACPDLLDLVSTLSPGVSSETSPSP